MLSKLAAQTKAGAQAVYGIITGNLATLVLAGIVAAGGYKLATSSNGATQPSTASEFADMAVMLTDKDQRSGGSGVIVRSTNDYSEVLTNKHVCKLLQGGGLVNKDGAIYLVDSIKRYAMHDLCLVKVAHSFGINAKIASSAPKLYDRSSISGHPGLLPNVLEQGNFTGRQIITLLVGFRACTAEDMQSQYGIYCQFFGAFPVLQTFNAQVLTGKILPGSSGSGVFNKDGEIAGLVFAGNGGGLGYAFIVPWEYVSDFLKTEGSQVYEPVQKMQYDAMIRSVFSLQKKCATMDSTKDVLSICTKSQKYLIEDLK